MNMSFGKFASNSNSFNRIFECDRCKARRKKQQFLTFVECKKNGGVVELLADSFIPIQ